MEPGALAEGRGTEMSVQARPGPAHCTRGRASRGGRGKPAFRCGLARQPPCPGFPRAQRAQWASRGSQSVSCIRTLSTALPCRPSTARAAAVNADSSSVSTTRQSRRARWAVGSVSSGISKRMIPCPRNGSRVRTRGADDVSFMGAEHVTGPDCFHCPRNNLATRPIGPCGPPSTLCPCSVTTRALRSSHTSSGPRGIGRRSWSRARTRALQPCSSVKRAALTLGFSRQATPLTTCMCCCDTHHEFPSRRSLIC